MDECVPDHLHPVVFGYIGDIVPSRRATFILGLVIIFLSTLSFALATKLWVLVTARLLQGLSTAVVVTVGYVLLAEVVGPGSLGKAIGYTTMAASFALMAGPVIGGALYEYCGYFAVFCPMLGLFVLDLVLRLMIIEEKAEDEGSSKPSPTEPTETTSKASSMEDASRQAASQPLLDSKTKSGTRAFLDGYKALLSSPRFIVALLAFFTQETIACGFTVILAPYLRDTFHVRASSAAVLYLAMAAPMLLAPLIGSLTDRFGPRLPTATGLVLAVLAHILLSLISHTTVSPLSKLAAIVVVLGLGFALSMPPLEVEVSLVVEQLKDMQPELFGPKGAYGRAYGLVNLTVGVSGLVGPLFAGFMRVAVGWWVLAWIHAGLSVVALVLVVLVTGGKWRTSKAKAAADAA